MPPEKCPQRETLAMLTDAKIRKLKPEEKTKRYSDEKGMYLEVTPKGGMYWRVKYRIEGKEKRLSIGVYPNVTLAEARRKRDEARQQIEQGIDPSAAKQQAKRETNLEDTFAYIGRQWLSDQEGAVKPYTHTRNRRMLENDLIPSLGHKPMRSIKSSDVLAVGKEVESRGALEVARRVIRLAGAVFRYAMRHDLADHDPTTGLTEALKPRKVENMVRVSKQELPELLHKIDGYEGDILTRIGLQMIAYTGVRTKELREMEWADIDVNAALWRIPAHKMKMEYPHIVPLSRQVLALLEQLKPITGHKTYVFQSFRTHKPISENTLIYAIYRIGYKSRMTVHGFRGVFATELYEQGYMSDAIERQLAHQEGNQVKAAYNHAQHLPYRVKMMQEWSDYLDSIRVGKIVAFPKATA